MAKQTIKPTKETKSSQSIMRAKDYRKKAAEIVKTSSGDFAVTYLVYSVIQVAASALFGIVALFTTGAFEFGLIHLAKSARDKHEKPKMNGNGLFYGFKERYGQSLGIFVMSLIFTVLWSLLFIIPGIIKSYSYAMSTYIGYDNPEKSTLDCITESRKLMNGNKWKLFCLRISYIGWFLLTILTLGILSFWVSPKVEQATYEFYLHISKKN